MTYGAFLVFLGLFGFRLPDFPMLKFGLLRLKTFARKNSNYLSSDAI